MHYFLLFNIDLSGLEGESQSDRGVMTSSSESSIWISFSTSLKMSDPSGMFPLSMFKTSATFPWPGWAEWPSRRLCTRLFARASHSRFSSKFLVGLSVSGVCSLASSSSRHPQKWTFLLPPSDSHPLSSLTTLSLRNKFRVFIMRLCHFLALPWCCFFSNVLFLFLQSCCFFCKLAVSFL